MVVVEAEVVIDRDLAQGGLLDASIVNLESHGPRKASVRPPEEATRPVKPWENPQMVMVRGQGASTV